MYFLNPWLSPLHIPWDARLSDIPPSMSVLASRPTGTTLRSWSRYQLRNSGHLGQFKCRTKRYRKSPLPHLSTRLFNNSIAIECSFLCDLWLCRHNVLSRFFFPQVLEQFVLYIVNNYLSLLNQLFLKYFLNSVIFSYF